jgi:hypothetical protein
MAIQKAIPHIHIKGFLMRVKKKKGNNGSKWFKPGKPLNWCKTDSQSQRRREALKARKGDYLATARALQSLANVNQDSETKRKAEGDSKYFRKMYYVKKNRKARKR